MGGVRTGRELVESATTEVVAETLHADRVDLDAEVTLEGRQVFLHDLVLQCASAGRHQDPSPAQRRGNQIRPSLASAGPSLDQESPVVLEHVLHGSGHPNLAGTMLVARNAPGQRSRRSKQVARIH